ncbi:VWA domain-containing protein [Mariniluteicoccus flavus]
MTTPDDDARPVDAPDPHPSGDPEAERLRRWRLVLGSDDTDGSMDSLLDKEGRTMDRALGELYDKKPVSTGGGRQAGLGASSPRVARWLGDIRTYFPQTVVQVMQRDAIERLDLKRLLLEPELMQSVEPDIHLATTLVQLGSVMPETSRSTARKVVRTVVEEVERRIAERTRSAVKGAINRAVRTHRPRLADIDWNRTIAKNLKHYLPEHKTVVPERLVGHGRHATGVQRDVVLAIDQSGSMAESVVFASIFGAVLATMKALKTSLVVFDTEVVDLTDLLDDPVDVIFGTQLGGGTDINRAIAYCQTLITRPTQSIFVLISDLYEGGVRDEMLRRMRQLRESGVQVVTLLALSDSGAPAYDHALAAELVALGIPAFACTPDRFPELLEEALSSGDLLQWSHDESRRGGAVVGRGDDRADETERDSEPQ